MKTNDTVSWVASILKEHEGRKNAITSSEIRRELLKHNIVIDGIKLRETIHTIRQMGVLPGVLAGSNGYYIDNSTIAVRKFCDSLQARADAILEVKNALLRDQEGRLF